MADAPAALEAMVVSAAAVVSAAEGESRSYDFRIAANDVDRTDIGGKFHIVGKGFGDEVGSVTVNGRNAYVSLANDAPHKARWSDENIYGQLPPMSVSGEVIVTTRDGKALRGSLKLADRKHEGDPRADATDDKARNPNT